MPTRTHVILDGLQDPILARQLSAMWHRAGFANAVDVSGQSAWLAPVEGDALDEAAVDHAATIARTFGIELRDRVGNTFKADNPLPPMLQRMEKESRQRLATSLMYGLPALLLHYLGPLLATGGGTETRSLLYPWLFEMLLVGWVCFAAGWPSLWNAALAVRSLRAHGDLLTTGVMLAAFVPSAAGVMSLPFAREPWVLSTQAGGSGVMFHFALMAVWLNVSQRWLMFRNADRLAGRASLMLAGFGRLIVVWLIVAVIVGATIGWARGLAVALLLPPLLSLGAVNRWSPGWSIVLPVAAFAVLLMAGDRLMPGTLHGVRGIEFEVAAGFGVMMTAVFGVSWGAWPRR
jgi:hypothetical protein